MSELRFNQIAVGQREVKVQTPGGYRMEITPVLYGLTGDGKVYRGTTNGWVQLQSTEYMGDE